MLSRSLNSEFNINIPFITQLRFDLFFEFVLIRFSDRSYFFFKSVNIR